MLDHADARAGRTDDRCIDLAKSLQEVASYSAGFFFKAVVE